MTAPVKNLVINSIGVILTSAISFLIVPVYTGTLGFEYFAIFATWVFVISLLQFVDLGYSITIIHSSGEKDEKFFNSKVLSYEIVIGIFIILFISVLTLIEMPSSGIYERIKKEIGPGALFLFLFPVFVGNLVKYYSFVFLAKGRFGLYNLFIVLFEVFKQVGGFFVLKFSMSWFYFFLYQSVLSLVFYLTLKVIYIYLYRQTNTFNLPTFISNISSSFNFTKVIFFSSILGALMSSFDRGVLSFNFEEKDIAIYTACFVVASIINMAIQPFHRLSLPLFVKLYKTGDLQRLGEILIALCALLSVSALSMGSLMVMYSDYYMPILLNTSISNNVIVIISILAFSFWFVACGWLPANLLQVAGFPSYQMKNMIFALLLGGGISFLFGSKKILIGVASIWVIHGIIQISLVPIISNLRCPFYSLIRWYKEVLIFPLIKVLLIILLAFSVKEIFGIIVSIGIFIILSFFIVMISLIRFKKVYAKV